MCAEPLKTNSGFLGNFELRSSGFATNPIELKTHKGTSNWLIQRHPDPGSYIPEAIGDKTSTPSSFSNQTLHQQNKDRIMLKIVWYSEWEHQGFEQMWWKRTHFKAQ